MQMLKRADADGDGKLSMEEAPPFLKKQFSKIDTNGDGFLDKSELESVVPPSPEAGWQHARGRESERLDQADREGAKFRPVNRNGGAKSIR